jgi:hypothetical protein
MRDKGVVIIFLNESDHFRNTIINQIKHAADGIGEVTGKPDAGDVDIPGVDHV